MSQVIVTRDAFAADRQHTREQEKQINREDAFAKWRLSDVTRTDPIAKLVGYSLMPILAFWGFLGTFLGFALAVAGFVFRTLGRGLGQQRQL